MSFDIVSRYLDIWQYSPERQITLGDIARVGLTMIAGGVRVVNSTPTREWLMRFHGATFIEMIGSIN